MNRYITRKSIAEITVFITTTFVSLWLFGPIQQPENSHTSTTLGETSIQPVTKREEPEQLIDIFSDEDISYNGYEMRQFTKKITDELYRNVEVSYAVLMKKDRRLLQFDGAVYFGGLGN